MPQGDHEEREDAAEKIEHVADNFRDNNDPDGAARADQLAQDIRESPELSGEQAEGLVNDARAGNWDHANQVIQVAHAGSGPHQGGGGRGQHRLTTNRKARQTSVRILQTARFHDDPPADAAVVIGTIIIDVVGDSGTPVSGRSLGSIPITNVSGGDIKIAVAGGVSVTVGDMDTGSIVPAQAGIWPTIGVRATVEWLEVLTDINRPNPGSFHGIRVVKHRATTTLQQPAPMSHPDNPTGDAVFGFIINKQGSLSLV